jgi:hypothetical protein
MEAAREMSKSSTNFSSKRSEEDFVVATQSKNLFVKLSTFVKQRVATCADYCPICDVKHGFGGFKPVVCENKGNTCVMFVTLLECMWRYEELGLGINIENELKTNPLVVDLLIVSFKQKS